MSTTFKGWTIPGPQAPGRDLVQPDPSESLDALSGHFRIFQLKNGHRFSTDDLLVAFYGTSWCPSAARILDLGSGVGTVGMVAAWRLPGAQLVTVEAQEQSVALAKKSRIYNGLSERYDIRLGDFREPSILQDNEFFDLVLGSPPYFPMGGGELGDHPQKIACRFEMRGNIVDYAQIAARHLTPGGIFACVFPIQPDFQHQRVKDAAQRAELTIVRYRPVIFKEGDVPLLGLFVMQRSAELPEWFRSDTWEEPALTIRTQKGDVHPEYMALKLAIGFPP